MELTIFYSWQSKTDKKRNQYYIKKHIEKAIKKIENKGRLEGVTFKLEDSAIGESGSPDISKIILDKRIPNCDIFIADLSIVNAFTKVELFFNLFRKKNNIRELNLSNNVLIEYGVALNSIKDERVIGILNSEYGSPKKNPEIIPFDIRKMRFPIEYNFNEGKELFVETLGNAISSCAITALRERTNKYKPFITWSEFARYTSNTSPFYENDYIISIKRQIKEIKNDIRFLGLPGIGKTRIIFESFRENNHNEAFNSLYCDYQEINEGTIIDSLEKIFESNSDNQILLIDNCPLRLCKKINKLKNEKKSSNKLIYIYHQLEERQDGDLYNVEYIELDKRSLDSIVSEILINGFSKIEQIQLDLIKDFSGGIPLMAVLLAENFSRGEDIGVLTNRELLDKLLSIDLTTPDGRDSKEILKSCSLFSSIGFDENFRDQIEFILSTRCITPADLGEDRMYKFDILFEKYRKREIFEINGRYFGIRPRPLAFYLAEEWFTTCTKERLNELVLALQDTSKLDTKSLTTALCNQIKYLGSNAKAVELIKNITDYDGPFDSAKVLNTELGSRLFRSFVEVNPVAVADNLYRNFGSLTIEELKQIDEGRRNLIWTLEKLCFDARTFEKGAKLMMRFALAENELCSNNSTGEFVRLFKLYLPGTEANLDDRLKIIQWGFVQDECKELVIKAIASALEINGNAYFCGAETQGTKKLQHYYPKSKDEICDYLSTLLNLIKEEIKLGNQFYDLCCHVLANKVRSLYDFGVWGIIEPIIYEVIEIRDNDWDELLDSLYNMKSFVSRNGQSDKEEVIEKLIVRLTKTDFVSRFIETNKYRHQNYSKELSFDDQMNKQSQLNTNIAKEYVNKEDLSPQVLEKLYTIEVPINRAFGCTIAHEIKADYQRNKYFIDNSIRIFKELDKYNPIIFVNYASGVSEEVKEYIVSVLQGEESLSYLLFPILAACNTNLDKTDVLFELVKKNVVQVSAFQTYWEFNLSNFSDDEISIFLNKILQLNDEAYITVLNMANTLIRFDSGTRYYKVEEIVEICIDNHGLSIMKRDYYYLIEAILKNGNKPSFAKKINHLLIQLAGDRSTYHYGNTGIETVFSVLISRYFDDIWDELSYALLSEENDYLVFFNLKSLLGSTIGTISNSVGILFANGDEDKIFAWCKANSEIAPRRIMELVPVFEGNGFNPFVLKLLTEFGNDKEMLSALNSNMNSFSWVGSVVPLFESKKDVLQSIVNHPIITVSDWAKQQIEYTEKEIEYEIKRQKEINIFYS